MAEARTCPNCGAQLAADAPDAPCPACLMKLGMDSWVNHNSVEPTIESPAAGGRFVPPSPAALADQFPKYEILDLLGHGGMGAVYKARQKSLDRLVAIKIIKPDAVNNEGFAERFHREATALAKLNHANVVGVIDFDEVDGLFYVVMEYVDGTDLRRLIETKSLPPDKAIEIIPQICDALQFAHDEGIVHRDIKPENILVDSRGRVKIADFGLAKLLANGGTDYALTGTHQVMGTPRYMAPEQMEGARAVDHRADIYSLGVVFYEMLTGELPLGRFDPPSHKATINEEWDAVIMRTLEKEPARRYQSASDIKLDVDKLSQVSSASPRSAPAPVESAKVISTPAALLLEGEAMGSGIVRLENRQVTFEFELSGDDAEWFECKAGLHRVHLPLAEVASAEFKPGWFGGEVRINTHSVRTLSDLPGSDATGVSLAITKDNGERAQQLVNEIARGSGREPKPMAADVDPAADVWASGDLMGNVGQVLLGGVMLAIGFTLFVARLAMGGGIHSPFIWVGMGLAMGGGGCLHGAFQEKNLLPRGTKPDVGSIMLALVFLVIGFGLFFYGVMISFTPPNPYIWVGIGLAVAGGGCLSSAWKRDESDTAEKSDNVAQQKPIAGKPPLVNEAEGTPLITGNLVLAWVTFAVAHGALSIFARHAANPIISWAIWGVWAVVTPTILCGIVIWAGQKRRGLRYPVHPGEWLWQIHALTIGVWLVLMVPQLVVRLLEINGVIEGGRVSATVSYGLLIAASLLHASLALFSIFMIRAGRWKFYTILFVLGMLPRVAAHGFLIASLWSRGGFPFATASAVALGFCVLPVLPLVVIMLVDLVEGKRYTWSHWVGATLQVAFHLFMLTYVIVGLLQLEH